MKKTIIEIPKSARASKRYWALWKMAKKLNLGEIEILIKKREKDLKYEKDYDIRKILKTEIRILEDAKEIIERNLR